MVLVALVGCQPPPAEVAEPSAPSVVTVEPSEMAPPLATPVSDSEYVQLDHVSGARWRPGELGSPALDAVMSRVSGSFAVLATADDAIRIAVPRGSVQLWIWVDERLAEQVLVGATPVSVEPGGPRAAVLAGGSSVDVIAERAGAMQIEATFSKLSTSLFVTGWIAADQLGPRFVRQAPPAVTGSPRLFDVEMRQSAAITVAPQGPTIARIDQGIMAVYATPVGTPKGEHAKVRLRFLDDEDAPVAWVEGYVDARLLVVEPKQAEVSEQLTVDAIVEGGVERGVVRGVIGGTATAEPTTRHEIPSGSCLFVDGVPEPIGRTTTATAVGEDGVVELLGLRLRSRPSIPPASDSARCTQRAAP
jgi:hypothetical protein